ncbi:hypothetical protein ACT8ZS_26105 [Paenibacillus sp. M.A.Huq-84]
MDIHTFVRGEGIGYGIPAAVEVVFLELLACSGWNTNFKGERYRSSTPHPFPLLFYSELWAASLLPNRSSIRYS